MRFRTSAAILALLGALLACGAAQADRGKRSPPAAWQELLEQSKADKVGLVFYVKGTTIPGVVTAIGEDAVEVRNQTHDRIVIRLERVDALGR